MKVYILKEEDFDNLLLAVDRNPEHGHNGGSSVVLTDTEKRAHQEAHAFYNLQVHRWVKKQKEP